MGPRKWTYKKKKKKKKKKEEVCLVNWWGWWDVCVMGRWPGLVTDCGVGVVCGEGFWGPFLGEGCVLWEDEAFAVIQHVYQPLCTLTHPHPPSLPTHTHPQLGVIDNNCM